MVSWQQFCDFIEQCLRKDPKKRPTVKQLLKHGFVARHTIDVSQVHFFVQPRTKREPEKEMSFIVDCIAASFTKDKQAEHAHHSRLRNTSSLTLPKMEGREKGGRKKSIDDAESKLSSSGGHRRSATAVVSPTADLGGGGPGDGGRSLPPVKSRGLRRSNTSKNLSEVGLHRPHTAEPVRQWFTKNRPFKGALETLARQLNLSSVKVRVVWCFVNSVPL